MIEAVPVAMAESVTVTVTVNGDPAALVGVQIIDIELLLEQPGGRFVHA